jgi:hypothetical protein
MLRDQVILELKIGAQVNLSSEIGLFIASNACMMTGCCSLSTFLSSLA